MGWYLRKSLKVGPIRFNLSKSGVGTSVGVKGLRIGSGPRGKYIHAGREGLYFRQSLPDPEAVSTPETVEDNPVIPGEREARPKDWLARTLKRFFLGR
jgi:hypothetical protein